jgi:hypothetical protein
MTIVLPYITDGLDTFKSIDLDESEEEVKDTLGKIYLAVFINLSSSTLYAKFYDADADDVEVGTTVPTFTIPIPTLGDTNGAGFILNVLPFGIQFNTAITVAVTTGVADNDSGAPGANECVATIFYK